MMIEYILELSTLLFVINFNSILELLDDSLNKYPEKFMNSYALCFCFEI